MTTQEIYQRVSDGRLTVEQGAELLAGKAERHDVFAGLTTVGIALVSGWYIGSGCVAAWRLWVSP